MTLADGLLSVWSAASKICARAATPEEAAQLGLRNDEDRVVMSVRRQTFAADGATLDVVDAVYDARRYAYEAEIRRDRGSASLGPASLTSTEKTMRRTWILAMISALVLGLGAASTAA